VFPKIILVYSIFDEDLVKFEFFVIKLHLFITS
jgi:hypothetical protein